MSQTATDPPELHDISLSVDEQGDSIANSVKVSKTNSLRRFFKLTHKKSGEANISEEGAMDKNKNKVDPEAGESSKEQSPQKRFHLRIGGSQKTDKDSKEPATSSTLSKASTSSKPTLKGSLSNYWNTVFKRHNPKRSTSPSTAANSHADDDGADSDEEMANETPIREEIHMLPISDDIATQEVAEQEVAHK